MEKLVAEWLRGKISTEGIVYQHTAAYEICEQFGERFVYINENGNLAISRAVFREFAKLKNGQVLWNRSEHYWQTVSDEDKALLALDADFTDIKLPDIEIPEIDLPDLDTEALRPLDLDDLHSFEEH